MMRYPQFLLALLMLSLHVTGNTNIPLPSLGDGISSVISLQKEKKLGHIFLAQLQGQKALIHNPLIKQYAETMIYRLLQASQVQDRQVDVVVLDDASLNAFAVPGGVIGINAGLWLNAQNEQQFASVLAHELAHLSQRHFARNLEQSQINRPTDIAAMMAGAIILAAGGSADAGVATLLSAQAAMVGRTLSYSRAFEQEADRVGMLNLEKAGMDPRAMPEMFKQLLHSSRFSGDTPPEFLLTHPVTENRISDTEARAAQYPKKHYTNSQAFYLIKHQLQLHYANNTQAALEQAQAQFDHHQGNQVANRYALALAFNDNHQPKKAHAMLAPLLKKQPHNPFYIIASAQIKTQSGQIPSALSTLKKALALSPDDFALAYTYINTLMANQNYPQAKPRLKTWTRIRPHDPDLWNLLAQACSMEKDKVCAYMSRAQYEQLTGNWTEADNQLRYAQQLKNLPFATREKISAQRRIIQAQKRTLATLH